MICGNCVFNQLKPEQKSQYLLGKPLSYFFDGFGSGEVPALICAVRKNTCVRKVEILQRCTMGVNVYYIPVFYEEYKKKYGKIQIKLD